MKILAVDDEQLMLEQLETCIKEAAPESEVTGFHKPLEALKYAEGVQGKIEAAFLDINMRGMNGLELGRKLKLLNSSINIIFCTGYGEYIQEAFMDIRASGYVMKPVVKEAIQRELENLRFPVEKKMIKNQGVYIQCFGNFEVFVDGKPLEFNTAKTKELFAYLVDRYGSTRYAKSLKPYSGKMTETILLI